MRKYHNAFRLPCRMANRHIALLCIHRVSFVPASWQAFLLQPVLVSQWEQQGLLVMQKLGDVMVMSYC
jgi:hypothetical protein